MAFALGQVQRRRAKLWSTAREEEALIAPPALPAGAGGKEEEIL